MTWGWRDGSTVTVLAEDPGAAVPAPTQRNIIACNPNFRVSDTVFCPLRAPAYI